MDTATVRRGVRGVGSLSSPPPDARTADRFEQLIRAFADIPNGIRDGLIAKDVQELDLIVQEKGTYQTLGTESTFTLTFEPQIRQQTWIESFYFGCKPAPSTSATLAEAAALVGNIYGFIQFGDVVINFNTPSVAATELKVLVNSQSVREIVVTTLSGDFPANLNFKGLLQGRAVASEFGGKVLT